uniref:cysteine desulfurase n=1 Tax=Hanusia phi TaxID=3032 RepID=A0A7S0I177_9CRYP
MSGMFGNDDPIYLDYGGTSPVDPSVFDCMKEFYLNNWGNPSSSHVYGQRAKKSFEQARKDVAESIGGAPHEIFFTSGGTESNNWVLKGAVSMARKRLQDHFTNNMGGSALSWSTMYVDQLRPHIVTTAIEHPAILEPLKWLQNEQQCDVTIVEPRKDGIINVQDVIDALRTQTVLVSIMHANNEVGAVQPLREISDAVRAWADEFGERGKQGLTDGILIHTDACQSVGKIPVDVNMLGVDLLSIAGHKLYAPKGIGALYVRGGAKGLDGDGDIRLQRFMHGGGQELGLRAGTENVGLAVALGKACKLLCNDKQEATKEQMRQASLIRSLHIQLQAKFVGQIHLNGPELPAAPVNGDWPRLPNTLSVGFRGLKAQEILAKVQDVVSASAGAACHSSNIPKISSVLAAMDVPEDAALGTIRFTVGRYTTEEEINRAAEAIANAANELFKASM